MILSLIVYSICTYYILKHLMQYNLQIDQCRFFNQTEQWYLQQPLLTFAGKTDLPKYE